MHVLDSGQWNQPRQCVCCGHCAGDKLGFEGGHASVGFTNAVDSAVGLVSEGASPAVVARSAMGVTIGRAVVGGVSNVVSAMVVAIGVATSKFVVDFPVKVVSQFLHVRQTSPQKSLRIVAIAHAASLALDGQFAWSSEAQQSHGLHTPHRTAQNKCVSSLSHAESGKNGHVGWS